VDIAFHSIVPRVTALIRRTDCLSLATSEGSGVPGRMSVIEREPATRLIAMCRRNQSFEMVLVAGSRHSRWLQSIRLVWRLV